MRGSDYQPWFEGKLIQESSSPYILNHLNVLSLSLECLRELKKVAMCNGKGQMLVVLVDGDDMQVGLYCINSSKTSEALGILGLPTFIARA